MWDSCAPANWWVITAIIAAIAFLIGRSMHPPTVSQEDALDVVEKAFKTRQHEAKVHARKKLPEPLKEARRAVLKGLEKLGIVASGWPPNPPP